MPQIYKNCKLYLSQFDLSGDVNQVAIEASSNPVKFTTFADETQVNRLGLKSVSASHAGYWNGGTGLSDEAIYNALSASSNPMTLTPGAGAEGDVAYAFNSLVSNYAPGGSVGDAFAFTVKCENQGADGLVRGNILLKGFSTSSNAGASQNLGNVSASQKLYGALHVLVASGTSPSITVRIQSATDQAFTTPVTRLTFNAATGLSSQWAAPVSGAITAPWWRADWTIAGTSPSFTFIVFIGIQ